MDDNPVLDEGELFPGDIEIDTSTGFPSGHRTDSEMTTEKFEYADLHRRSHPR